MHTLSFRLFDLENEQMRCLQKFFSDFAIFDVWQKALNENIFNNAFIADKSS